MLFLNVSLHTSTFLAERQVVDARSPAGRTDRDPGAIRALWSAWQKPSKFFFSAGLDDQDNFPGFSTRGLGLYVRTGKNVVRFLPSVLLCRLS